MLTRTLVLCCAGLVTGLAIVLLHAQHPIAVSAQGIQKQEDQLIRDFKLPSTPAEAPIYRPQAPVYQPEPEPATVEAVSEPSVAPVEPVASEAPTPQPEKKAEISKPQNAAPMSQYVLQFNRSPAIGNRFRLQGTYAEARIGFTRPKNWNVKSAKAVIRFQHSPAIISDKSNLIVRVNDTSIGSVPMNLKNAQIGEAIVNIPANLVQDYNEITIVAQQTNSATCANPDDKVLWSEVLPDSKVILDYQPQSLALDFSRYPFPFFDNLGLDTPRLNYLLPAQINEAWLTATSRFHTHFGRLADFRSLETSLVKDTKKFEWNDRLVIIGTPQDQPTLKSLKLPLNIANNQILDGSKNALPENVGVLMLTTLNNGNVPVIVASGNGAEGVAKAVQFLVQPNSSQIGSGQVVLVRDVAEVASPNSRSWERYLPLQDSFQLSALKGLDNKPFKDVTVRGTSAPPVQFQFRSMPDDRMLRGSSMNLKYSYSAQVNSRKSSVSVRIDGVTIGSKKLTSENGGNNELLNVDLPPNLIKSDSVIDVAFDLYPRETVKCGQVGDQQLWGTVHSTTDFNLKRENSVELPDLKLLTTGYPFAAPQDLSKTAIVVPDSPTEADVMTVLKFSERMGRLSQANSVKLDVFTASNLPETVKNDRHLVAIGVRDRFPIKEMLEANSGFRIMDAFARESGKDQIHALPDQGGVIKSMLSPWNRDRTMVALTAQTDSGLKQVQDVLSNDLWFYQLKEDTALISTNQVNPSPYDSNAYQMQFLNQSERRRIENTTALSKARQLLQEQWYLLPIGIIASSLLLYGIAQILLKRVAG
ncbi:cellulose biosynthesis cyclic di-GMP-binding regulatory protein BcsB [Leptolyngbya sp. NIES-2104]|uniref:cellulose biosynthesis cyclic di-GMP-binding regulatory protein BcsB n=1 Tax=Leptolyngbya sp. NIES-2104 TaxID=1552121 RepID=UPI000AAC08D3|nr:cellulose biosynthesis cyclic di-GMP-binding regulatory protein BcsB [Leptolyngbya sp. NIES-2104]